MQKLRFAHPLVAVLVLVSLLLQGTWVLAGTTGSLSGTVVDSASNAPIAQATVTATSPSQTVSTKTDNGGHFTFASLAPDTYTVSIEKEGYDPVAQAGINVFADQEQTLRFATQKALREIGRVTSRAATDLVKPGTTADVYSVNALQQSKFSGVGGGGGLNNAYSAIATVPGAYVPTNQAGYFQTISIRGGDYDQVGYEVDGVPVNRSFDNYPSGTASSLGQQELQVYTGAAPANAEGQGLSGFINQVIRAGTYPGFIDADLGIGGPTYYHKASLEFGGATPNRNFSYYVGLGGYNQDFRYVDQFNGRSISDYGPILGTTGPTTADQLVAFGPLVTAPFQNGNGQVAFLTDRDAVANVHIGLPHKDGSKDDIQLLYLNNHLESSFFSSVNDVGLSNIVAAGGGVPTEADAYQYNGPVGVPLPSNAASLVSPYYFPSSGQNRPFGAPIPPNNRDSYQNDQSIFKVQYQKNFSSNAYFRLYGYTDYSDWLQNGQNFANYVYLNLGQVVDGVSPDYELSSHSRGISGTLADQINAKNLIQLQGSYTTASTLRDNNVQFLNAYSGKRKPFAVLVNAADPLSGYCYNAANTAVPVDCNTYAGKPSASVLKLGTAYAAAQSGTPLATPGVGQTCGNATVGTGPCEYFVVENGQYATYNTVKPNFVAGSLTDTFKPSDRLLINAGIRYDFFQFQGSDTTATPARTLFFNSFNKNECIDSSGVPNSKKSLGILATDPCPAGFTKANLVNASAQVNSYPVFEPRLGLTYTLNPDTVLRASYGRYAQAPNTAFEQYNALQQNTPYSLLGTAFYKYGFNTPGHQVQPEVSNNYDFSIEHHFKGTDVSFKLTPFYRYTQNQIQTFFLDQASGFVSGLNADRLTSRGVEFQINKGDFGRNGFAGQLAFTYTNAYAQYNTFSNGATVFTGINNDIATYNQYTSFCATHFTDKRCGGLTAAPTTAVPTVTGADGSQIANPYYNAPVQGLVDPNGKYAPFSLVTGPIGASANSYLVPYQITAVMQYKKGPFAITPSLQFAAGQRYGVPETSPGVDPASCSALAGATSTVGDPRYPYGSVGGLPYDASTCNVLGAIPNPYTKRFDGIGDFVNPSQLVGNVQLSYEASKNVTFVATLANVLNTCFGGSNVPWANGGSQVCSYGLVDGGNSFYPVGNAYNPGANIDPAVKYPYQRSYGAFNTDGSSTKLPFSVYLDAKLKL
jgi:hypothetical protein